MKKHTVKNGRFFIIPIISFFLLFFAIGLFIFQLFKAPKEVKAVVGTLDIKAITGSAWTPGGIWNSSGNVGIGTTNPAYPLSVNANTNGMTYSHVQNLTAGTAAGTGFRADSDTAGGHVFALSGSYTSLGSSQADSFIVRSFTTSSGDLNITGNTNICSLVAYTATSGTTYCPAGYYVWSATATTTGDMLCCKVSNPI